MSNIVHLFPLSVLTAKREASQEEKDLLFEAYLKNSDEDGRSMDFHGFNQIHLEKTLEPIYKDIHKEVENYLTSLSLSPEDFIINFTKAWFHVKNNGHAKRHDHGENDISWTYYPHIAPGKERNLVFYDPKIKGYNEPNPSFFENNVNDWNYMNARSFAIPAEEGTIMIFPADIEHEMARVENGFGGVNAFKTKEELMGSRFCLAGDIKLTRANHKEYKRTLPPIEQWKSFK